MLTLAALSLGISVASLVLSVRTIFRQRDDEARLNRIARGGPF